MNQASTITVGTFAVEFERSGDRFGHRVWFVGSDEPRLLLESIETDRPVDPAWPPSPPLQELHWETRASGDKVALLVGMAGKSHWSLSCRGDRASGTIVLDAACRVKQAPQWLGSSYRLGPGVEFDPERQVLQGACRLELGGARLWSAEPGVLAIAPDSTLDTLPATVEWSYMLLNTV